ncbi:hypothetical protein BDZ89DRAFT_917366, partial [Hymenopellis radicata]
KDNAKPTRVVHPADYHLRRIAPDDEIIERCGQHVFLMVVPPNHLLTQVDFVFYNAYDQTILAEVQQHHEQLSGMKPLTRGQQFRFWTGGTMICFGSRQPSGGGPGDNYTIYAGMDCYTINGMKASFNMILGGLLMNEVARRVWPDVFRDMKKATECTDHFGVDGMNLYRCRGYRAPLHRDHDVCRGLCGQVEWDADAKFAEYAFCQPEWGYYIVTRANMIWSFDSSDLHGTMLPS